MNEKKFRLAQIKEIKSILIRPENMIIKKELLSQMAKGL
jgi:hypothetical protein